MPISEPSLKWPPLVIQLGPEWESNDPRDDPSTWRYVDDLHSQCPFCLETVPVGWEVYEHNHKADCEFVKEETVTVSVRF